MPILLSPFVGSGTEEDPFRVPVDGSHSIIDFRGECTSASGFAVVNADADADISDIRLQTIGEVFDSRLPRSLKTFVEGRLGVTLDQSSISGILAELLLIHATADFDQSKWNRLRSDRSGFYEIWLGGLAYRASAIVGKAITETFDTPDTTTLGPDLNWTETTGNLEILSNRVSSVATATVSEARAEHDLGTVDHFSQVQVWVGTGGGDADSSQGRPLTRFDNSARTHYMGEILLSTDGATRRQIAKRVAGTFTSLSGPTTQAWVDGHTARLTTSGSTVTLARTNTDAGVAPFATLETLATVTDTSITTGTKAGISARRYKAATLQYVDTFAAGTLTGPWPNVVSSNSGTAATASHAVPMPATITAGNLLIIFAQLNTSGITVTTPAGWTRFANDAVSYCYAKTAVGGDTATLELSALRGISTVSMAIEDWSGDIADIEAVQVGGLNPAGLVPTWPAGDDLYLEFVGMQGGTVPTVTSWSFGYTEIAKVTGDYGTDVFAGAAFYKPVWAKSENPLITTASGSPSSTTSFTVAVRSASRFPSIRSSNSNATASGTSHAVSMPASITAGDLLIIQARLNNAGVTVTAPAGWTEISGAGSPEYTWAKIAAGSDTATVTTSGNRVFCFATIAVQDWHGTIATGVEMISGSGSNPGALTPAWGWDDTLWLVVATASGGTLPAMSAWSSGFTEVAQVTVDAVTDATSGLAQRQQALPNKDPDAGVTFSGSPTVTYTGTIAIRPGPAVGGGGTTVFFFETT